MKASSNILLSMCIGVALTAGFFGCGRSALAQTTGPSAQTQPSKPSGSLPPANPNSAAKSTELTAEQRKTLYAFGAALANNMRDFYFSPEEKKIVQAAFMEVSGGEKAKVDIAAYTAKLRALFEQRQQQIMKEEKTAGAAYLDKAAKESGAVKLESGLVMRTLKQGKGPKPTEQDTVKVVFTTMLIDGTVVDGTKEQGGKSSEVSLMGMMPCWSQGISRMQVGSKSRLVCPSELAHGDTGASPKIKPGATLIFDVELLEIVKQEKPSGNS